MKISKITPKKSPSQYMTSFCQFWSKFTTAKAVYTFRIIPELTLPKLSKVGPSGAHFRAFFVTEGLRGSLGVFSKVLTVLCVVLLGWVSCPLMVAVHLEGGRASGRRARGPEGQCKPARNATGRQRHGVFLFFGFSTTDPSTHQSQTTNPN